MVSSESSFSKGPGGGHCIDSSITGITGVPLSRASSMAFWILALPAPSGPMHTTRHPCVWIAGSGIGLCNRSLSDRVVVKPFEFNLLKGCNRYIFIYTGEFLYFQQTYQCIDKKCTSRLEHQWCRSLNGLKIIHLWPQIPEYYTNWQF